MKRIMTMVAIIFALALPTRLLAAGDISYCGSISIGSGILEAGAVNAFEKKTGIKFSKIDNSGSGKGIKALKEGNATLAGLGRSIKPEEKKDKLSATTIGYDAIAVFVHKNNPIKNISKEQLKGVYTRKITNWKDVGGKSAVIAATTEKLSGEKRGAVEMFQKMILDGAEYGTGMKEFDSPKDQLVDLAKNDNGICTVSLGLLSTLDADTRSKIKTISVQNFAPDSKNIQSGSYPISVPLQLVTAGLPKDAEKEFIKYILSAEGQAIVGKNFVPVRK
jgi:phosphate transport system substrate-binding protein